MTTAAMLPALDVPPSPRRPAPPLACEGSVGVAKGMPRALLRLEGALVLGAALLAYAHLGGSWGWFAALFLLPDLSMLGYLAGPRVGAATYNAAHSHLAPALLAAASFALNSPALLLGAAIWVGHIGFDRMLGYGLKYETAFGETHLGRLGSRALSSNDGTASDRARGHVAVRRGREPR